MGAGGQLALLPAPGDHAYAYEPAGLHVVVRVVDAVNGVNGLAGFAASEHANFEQVSVKLGAEPVIVKLAQDASE